MLKRFSVINFKNFGQKTELILDHPSNYEFNNEIIQNDCISKGIFYGINGSGKSNLALALFDIILHLTDKEKALDKYMPYLNLSSCTESILAPITNQAPVCSHFHYALVLSIASL